MMAFSNSFRMKMLGKQEYYYMKELIKGYNLDDPSELFNGLLRLHYEMGKLDIAGFNSHEWFTRILGEVRDKLEFVIEEK